MGVILFYLLTSKLPFENHYLDMIQESKEQKKRQRADLHVVKRRSKNYSKDERLLALNNAIISARSLSLLPSKNEGTKVEDTRKQIELLILKEDPPVYLIHGNSRSSSSIDLVLKLLNKDPDKRLTISEALKHPWNNANLFKKKNTKM